MNHSNYTFILCSPCLTKYTSCTPELRTIISFRLETSWQQQTSRFILVCTRLSSQCCQYRLTRSPTVQGTGTLWPSVRRSNTETPGRPCLAGCSEACRDWLFPLATGDLDRSIRWWMALMLLIGSITYSLNTLLHGSLHRVHDLGSYPQSLRCSFDQMRTNF